MNKSNKKEIVKIFAFAAVVCIASFTLFKVIDDNRTKNLDFKKIVLITKDDCSNCEKLNDEIYSLQKLSENKYKNRFESINLKKNEKLKDNHKTYSEVLNQSDSEKTTPYLIIYDKKNKAVFNETINSSSKIGKAKKIIGSGRIE